MKNIICIGSISRDIFFPMENMEILDTPEDLTAQRKIVLELGAKYAIGDRYEVPGGCSANVSQGLSRLGISASCLGVLGKDSLGMEIRAELEGEGVDVSKIRFFPQYKTDLSFVLVDKKGGDRTILYNRDANEHLNVRSEDIEDAYAVFVSGLYGAWKDNIETVSLCCAHQGIPFFYNPGQRNLTEDMESVLLGIRSCFCVFLNKDEAIEIAMHLVEKDHKDRFSDETFLLQVIRDLGPMIVSITDGSRGAWVFDGVHVFYAPAEKVDKVVDSTGAGDAYTSGFLSAFVKEKDIPECLKWGISNGRNVVQYYGAKEGLLHINEIGKRAERVVVKILSGS